MRRLLITVQMGLLLFAGCGQGTYDERLENRISELKSQTPAAAEEDAAEEDAAEDDSQDVGDEEITDEDGGAEEAADEG